MKILLTGAYGSVGTAVIDYLHDDNRYEFTYFNRSDRPQDHPYGGYDTRVGTVQNYAPFSDCAAGHDAMIHLAGFPSAETTWDDVHHPNIVGMQNALRIAREEEMETFVFASTNHVLGMYEQENAPDIYEPGHGVALDRDSEVRPDSFYATSKAFGEDLGRQYAERYEYPESFYAIRICSLRMPEYDHPYGDAEQRAETGEIERGSPEYAQQVARMKAMWHSRRDFAHQIECCLEDDTIDFGIYNGVSDNDRRWFSIEHARTELGYSPVDNGEEWEAPPA